MIVTVPLPVEHGSIALPPAPRYDGVSMSLEAYRNWEPIEPDGFKYEWNDGVLEAEESMKLPETRIYRNINRQFVATDSYHKGTELIAEVECFFPAINKVRKPDICALRKDQIENPASPASSVPAFVIEIISPSNASQEVERKMREYFQAGVRVVWHIYPALDEVRVYSSPKLITVCTGDDFCTAAPAFEDFAITANAVFA